MNCQQSLPEDGLDLCVRCGTHKRGFAQAIALGPYAEGWRRLILHLKAGSDRIVAGFLSARLAEELRQQPLLAPNIITFVPMTARERRCRGFNQSRLLAVGTAHRCGLPVARLLTKRVDTRRQSLLGAEQRRANLREAFRAVRSSPEVKSESVLLVDDVFTTGATAEACSQALLNAGYREVTVLVVARAEGSATSR
ncbi:ComF family protein [Candidatus Bipolaricaulota bacterium]|nr:ComF family protein [Candidatus Bipolaricaulota bacterium]